MTLEPCAGETGPDDVHGPVETSAIASDELEKDVPGPPTSPTMASIGGPG